METLVTVLATLISTGFLISAVIDSTIKQRADEQDLMESLDRIEAKIRQLEEPQTKKPEFYIWK